MRLLQSGAVVLYHKPAVLAQDVGWLQSAGYRVVALDAATWRGAADFHDAARRAFGFPDYYGANFAAWIDCLGDLDVPHDGGVAIQIRRFDSFVRADPRLAQMLLDSFESISRRFLVTGRRLITLVQSDDARLRFERVGAVPVNWNAREWLESDRGLRPAS